MHKTLKTFFVFSLLLVFLSNVSGISVCLDHAKHLTSKAVEKKHSKEDNGSTFSQDDECQCALHLQMNNILIPEIQNIEFVLDTVNDNEIPQLKTTTYRCLLDFFSSRAPPHFS
jgi:hypothetical protein